MYDKNKFKGRTLHQRWTITKIEDEITHLIDEDSNSYEIPNNSFLTFIINNDINIIDKKFVFNAIVCHYNKLHTEEEADEWLMSNSKVDIKITEKSTLELDENITSSKYFKKNEENNFGNKLLPCPFCGSHEITMEKTENYKQYVVICTDCDAEVKTDKKATQWNRRDNIKYTELEKANIQVSLLTQEKNHILRLLINKKREEKKNKKD